MKKLIITNIPAFYKTNLYNAIHQQIPIEVVYTGAKDSLANGKTAIRNKDFLKGEMLFPHHFLIGNTFSKTFQLLKILKNNYSEVIIGGWDAFLLLLVAFLNPKKNNALVVESSYKESATSGIKAFIKKLFIRRIHKVYASGVSQEKLVQLLGFKNKCVITKGVGIYNRKFDLAPLKTTQKPITNFLYVGRLSDEKNIFFMMEAFKQRPHLTLNIIGYGPLEQQISTVKPNNVHLLGAVPNKQLAEYYQANDVFVLLSHSETWGLVVEEALNNCLPVLLSENVGCAEELDIEGNYGLLTSSNDLEKYLQAIDKLQNIEFYNELCNNIHNINFKQIETQQIDKYIEKNAV